MGEIKRGTQIEAIGVGGAKGRIYTKLMDAFKAGKPRCECDPFSFR